MAKYVTLLKYTHEGIAGINDLENRLEDARNAAAAMGVTIEAYYLTMGHYDAVVISEAPDSATVAKFILTMGGTGRFATETLAAFSENEAIAIAGELSP